MGVAMMVKKIKSNKGQMVVELAVVFPILIIVACVMVNALGFATECARFDRVSRNIVRTEATTPAIDENNSSALARVVQTLEGHFAYDNELTTAKIISERGSNVTIECELRWSPTLFGVSFKDEVFGMKMFELSHRNTLVIDPTRAGDVF